ncbi:MAG: protein-L-isoaspartate(D-aspartate) O-methyltransferase [Planctomycetaceae bacterium]
MPIRWFALLAVFLPGVVGAQPRDAFEQARQHMVDEFIEAEGVTNERVLKSMRTTPRHEFVRPGDVRSAYHDSALPIGHGQTISPPFIVAYMTETIDPQPTDKILEIGTGSGYQAAVLSPLVQDVYTIEIVEELARSARRKLESLDYDNVHAKAGDGYQGWPEHAPFDKIIVTCSPEQVPAPLVEQLAEGGKLLIPLGERYQQVFYLFEKRDGKLAASKLIPTLFVPMTGVSEERRQQLPNPLHPEVVNGGFEEDANDDGRPDGWHYLRQSTIREGDAAGGDRSLTIENADPGRLAQALQGFAIDGRKIAGLDLSASMWSKDVRSGPSRGDRPGIVLLFFDQTRKTIGAARIAPPIESDGWSQRSQRVPVPIQTREAILAVTLGGGTGELGVDEVTVNAVAR